jgi:hypothetical protein
MATAGSPTGIVRFFKLMTPEQFLQRCRLVCHVGPAGVWEQIARHGFRTAEQLILEADLDEEERRRLLSTPRREPVRLRANTETVVLRDQGPLFARKDLTAILGDGLDVNDWIQLLNRRVYFFTDETSMRKLADKYIELDGAQEVIWLSPLKLLHAASGRLELTAQNTGAIARRSGPQKTTGTFLPLSRFPDRRPAELTILDGLADLTPVVRAERLLSSGRREPLSV